MSICFLAGYTGCLLQKDPTVSSAYPKAAIELKEALDVLIYVQEIS